MSHEGALNASSRPFSPNQGGSHGLFSRLPERDYVSKTNVSKVRGNPELRAPPMARVENRKPDGGAIVGGSWVEVA